MAKRLGCEPIRFKYIIIYVVFVVSIANLDSGRECSRALIIPVVGFDRSLLVLKREDDERARDGVGATNGFELM